MKYSPILFLFWQSTAMDTIIERQAPTSLNCKPEESEKSPKIEAKSPRRATRLLRQFSEETTSVLLRMTKSDSCLVMRRSKWKMVKNSIIFIRKNKDLEEAGHHSVDHDVFDIDDILTDELKEEIFKLQGQEFDLYLNGLRWRNFDNASTPM